MRKRFTYYFVYLACFMLFFTMACWAEESVNPDAEDEIVITATRTPETETEAPGKSDVVTEEQIKDSGATTVSEALSDAGVTVSTYGGKSGAANVQLDGSGSTQTLVLVNGVPGNTGIVGSIDLSCFPTTSIKRIEVAHGPLSALYGSNALGGVVNIITDLTGEPESEVGLNFGSFNTKGIDYKYQQEKWGIVVGLNTTDGYRVRSQTNSNYLLGQYNFIESNDEYLKLYWQYLNKNGQDPGSLTSPYSDANQLSQDLAINLNGGKIVLGGNWEYKIFTQYLDYHYDLGDYNSHSRHQTTNYGVDLAGKYILDQHELLIGMLIRQEQLDSTDCGKQSRNDDALFIQDGWQLSEKLKLITGLRQDFYSNYSSPLSPRVSLVDSITDQWSIKLGYGKTFRVPTFGELYWQPGGNKDLKPEQGERYDFIAEWKQDKRLFSIDFYQSNLEDGINPWPIVNIDKMRIQGLNLNWENTWTDQLMTNITYNIIDKKGYDQTSGQYSTDLNAFGKQQINLGLTYHTDKWRYNLNWYLARERNKQMPDYDVMNLCIKYAVSNNQTVTLAVDNLTNKDYQVNSDYPMPERTFTLSAEYKF